MPDHFETVSVPTEAGLDQFVGQVHDEFARLHGDIADLTDRVDALEEGGDPVVPAPAHDGMVNGWIMGTNAVADLGQGPSPIGRLYFQSGDFANGRFATDCGKHLAVGATLWVSVKGPGNNDWKATAEGVYDDWIRSWAAAMLALPSDPDNPHVYTYHHEPFGGGGGGGTDRPDYDSHLHFLAASRIREIMLDEGVDEAEGWLHAPVYMTYNFKYADTGGPRDLELVWPVDADSPYDIIGFDHYWYQKPKPEGTVKTYLDAAAAFADARHHPLWLGEWGTELGDDGDVVTAFLDYHHEVGAKASVYYNKVANGDWVLGPEGVAALLDWVPPEGR